MTEQKLEPLNRKDPLVIKLEKFGLPENFLREVEQRLKDHLTGLPKDETCRAIVEQLIQSGRRVTLEFDDLRFLKTFNETIGHERTNALLREIAETYRNQEKTLSSEGMETMVGRYAGDSFIVIVPDLSKEESGKILERIHYALKQIKNPEGAPFKPHFSRGIADSEELLPGERTYAKLIELADNRAKKEKRAKWDYIKRRAKKRGNIPTRRLVTEIQRYG